MKRTHEEFCIAEAMKARIALAERELDRSNMIEPRFDGGAFGYSGFKIEWKEGSAARIRQVLAMPIALVLFFALFLLSPIGYLLHLRDIRKNRILLRGKLKDELMRRIEGSPSTKSIESLWRFCGLYESGLEWTEEVKLLHSWIEALYGTQLYTKHELISILDEIAECNARANRPYFMGEKGATHFLFIPRMHSLIAKISKELPPYKSEDV